MFNHFKERLTFCKFGLTNVSPDGVLLRHSGGRLSSRRSLGFTFKQRLQKIKILGQKLLFRCSCVQKYVNGIQQ